MKEKSTLDIKNNYDTNWMILFVCWLLSLIATLVSLFFSSVLGMEPCVLCWYQRIFMYPLVVIFLIALFPLDTKITRYTLPIALIGLSFAVYHYLLYMGVIPEGLKPCGKGPSCTKVDLELFGFITIPMLSIMAYSSIVILLLVFRKRIKDE